MSRNANTAHPSQFLSLRESRRVVNVTGTEDRTAQAPQPETSSHELAARAGMLQLLEGIFRVIFSPKSLTWRIDGAARRRYSQRRYRIWSLTPSRRFLRHFRAAAPVCLRSPGPQSNRNYALINTGRRSDAPPSRWSHPIWQVSCSRRYLPMKRTSWPEAIAISTSVAVREDIENIEDRSGDHAKP